MKKALLVIDVDHADGWNPENVNRSPDLQQVAEDIKVLLAKRRKEKGVIIFITYFDNHFSGQEFQNHSQTAQQQNTSQQQVANGCLVCDADESIRMAAFLEHRHDDELEPAFVKRTCDAFTNENLQKFLRAQGVDEVELVGCFTNVCVQATAVGALNAGFKVTLRAKASYPHSVQNKADASW